MCQGSCACAQVITRQQCVIWSYSVLHHVVMIMWLMCHASCNLHHQVTLYRVRVSCAVNRFMRHLVMCHNRSYTIHYVSCVTGHASWVTCVRCHAVRCRAHVFRCLSRLMCHGVIHVPGVMYHRSKVQVKACACRLHRIRSWSSCQGKQPCVRFFTSFVMWLMCPCHPLRTRVMCIVSASCNRRHV
jgi:hypothetical protein